MQSGPYIAERLMPAMIQAACAERGIAYQTYSDEWVQRLEKHGAVRWVVGYKFDLNRSAAGELAQDKVATYSSLQAAGIPAIEHYLVRSLPHEPIHTHVLLETLAGKPVVIKPLDGTGGRDVLQYATVAESLAAITRSGEPAWAMAPYYNLQSEYRLVMLGDKVLLAYEKTQPTKRGELKLFNLSYGAVAVDVADGVLLQELQAIALEVMRTTALRLAAVDIVRMPDDSLRVLEVNDGVMMEHYARQSVANKNRAAELYGTIVSAMFS